MCTHAHTPPLGLTGHRVSSAACVRCAIRCRRHTHTLCCTIKKTISTDHRRLPRRTSRRNVPPESAASDACFESTDPSTHQTFCRRQCPLNSTGPPLPTRLENTTAGPRRGRCHSQKTTLLATRWYTLVVRNVNAGGVATAYRVTWYGRDR